MADVDPLPDDLLYVSELAQLRSCNPSTWIGSPSGHLGGNLRERWDTPVKNLPSGAASPLQEEPNMQREVIMAVISSKSSSLGCSFFNTEDGVLALLEDLEDLETVSLDLVHELLEHIRPTTVLVPAKGSEEVLEVLEQYLECLEDELEPQETFALSAVTASEFDYDAALSLLDNLSSNARDDANSMIENCMPATSKCNLESLYFDTNVTRESRLSVSCAGCILSHLSQRCSIKYLPDEEDARSSYQVSSVSMFHLSDYMYIGRGSLQALQIFSANLPSHDLQGTANVNGHANRESISIYGLFHRLVGSPQGRIKLKSIFSRPTTNLNTLRERQKIISYFVRPDAAEQMMALHKTLRKIPNVRSYLNSLRRGIDKLDIGTPPQKSAWGVIHSFTTYVLQLRDIVASIPESAGLCLIEEARKLRQKTDMSNMEAVERVISSTVDLEQTQGRVGLYVKNGVNKELDDLKRTYDGLDHLLGVVIGRITQQVPQWAVPYIRSCIFMPQLGFLTVVRLTPHQQQGMYEMGDEFGGAGSWEKLFIVDGAAYYKNSFMLELDGYFGDIWSEIRDIEVEILHNSALKVLQFEHCLTKISDACGSFDAVLALAIGAAKYGWVQPNLVPENVLTIRGGRHPLQEAFCSRFISNNCEVDARMEETRDSCPTGSATVVITGPNQSGKSIYLKQVAIIVFLAHLGSFIPATGAVIGLTDKILTRISTRESLGRPESAFAMDLQQISHTIRRTGHRSLVIIDEFGKGTNADDGAGLVAALLSHFHSLGRDRPKLLLATHFHEICTGVQEAQKHYNIMHMEVRAELSDAVSDLELTYLFKLVPGRSSASFGLTSAIANGVPSIIITRAQAIANLLRSNEDVLLPCVKLSTQEEEQLEEAEAVTRRFLRADLDRLPDTGCRLGFGTGDAKQILLKMFKPNNESEI